MINTQKVGNLPYYQICHTRKPKRWEIKFANTRKLECGKSTNLSLLENTEGVKSIHRTYQICHYEKSQRWKIYPIKFAIAKKPTRWNPTKNKLWYIGLQEKEA